MSRHAKKLSPSTGSFETLKERNQLTKIIMKLFTLWQLSTREQLLLLGMRENSRYMLQRYRQQESVLPFEKDKLDRAGLLLVIYEDLYALFPENEKIRYEWIQRKNTLLGDKKPIDIMVEQGVLGLARVARFLDMQMVM